MNNHREYFCSGLTLIETIVYAALLSLFLFGFIQYAVETNYQNIDLSHEIDDAQKK